MRREQEALERRGDALQQVRQDAARGLSCNFSCCFALGLGQAWHAWHLMSCAPGSATWHAVSKAARHAVPPPSNTLQELSVRKAALDEREQRLLQAEADLKVARSEQERAARQLAATQAEAEAARAEAERLQRRAASEAESLESRSAGLAAETSAATEQRLAATAKLRDVEQREEAVFRAEREAAALQARLERQQAELADKAAALAEAATRHQAETAAFEAQRRAWTDGEAGRRELLAREAELREEAGVLRRTVAQGAGFAKCGVCVFISTCGILPDPAVLIAHFLLCCIVLQSGCGPRQRRWRWRRPRQPPCRRSWPSRWVCDVVCRDAGECRHAALPMALAYRLQLGMLAQ